MRARTKRLKSLLVGIVSVLWSGHGSHAPRQRRPAATQRLPRCRSGSPPPFASPRGVDHRPRPKHASSERGLQGGERSEEHTSELQSHSDLVCRLLLEKK